MDTKNGIKAGEGIEDTSTSSRSITLSLRITPTLGQLPEVVFISSFGLLSITLAFFGNFAGPAWSQVLFWVGLALLILPVAFRVSAKTVSRNERIGLLAFAGLGLYLVKLMHSPYMFTFSDEMLHFRNAENILLTGKLFAENTILPVSAYYPGLETVTSAIASVSGLSLFASGLLVIGIARLILVLSMFLLFEQIGRSNRVASLATLLYIANSNFLYWSAQFSYESLSLPLGVLVLYVLIKHIREQDNRIRHAYTAIFWLLLVAIIITHHLTSYFLVAFLLTISLIFSFLQVRTKVKQPFTWHLAVISAGLTLLWLFGAAHPTVGYLRQIFTGAWNSSIGIISGMQASRPLFTSATGTVAPFGERLLGMLSVLLIVQGILVGLYLLVKRHKLTPFIILFTGISLVYLITLGLRFTAGGWEIANRSSEFIFLGIAFLVGFAFSTFLLLFPDKRLLPIAFTAYLAIIFAGGIISGWPPSLRVPGSLLVQANRSTLHPQGVEASSWLLEQYGPGNRLVAPTSDAMLMLSYGRQDALTGKISAIQELLTTPHTPEWQSDILRTVGARFLVMDRRQISWNGMLGAYFTPASDAYVATQYYSNEIISMFDGYSQVPRLFDSGDIVIYDVGGLSGVSAAK